METPPYRTCPLMDGLKCLEKSCAWWNHIDEECSVATLGVLARHLIKGAEGR